MMRLSDRSPSRDEAVLQVDGWVSDGWVQVLEREGTRLLKQSRCLAVAAFPDRGESPDVESTRFTDVSPASYALSQADDQK